MDASNNEYAELRKLAEAATPGPWFTKRHGCIVAGPMREYTNGSAQSQIASFNVTFHAQDDADEPERQQANTEFCAAANPSTILRLLDALEMMNAWRVTAEIASLAATQPQPVAVSAPTDEVTQEQAVLLAGIQALCISTNQELSRRDGSLSEFDKGWFLGQLHIFDMYTPVEKGALNEAREYLRAITSAQAPQQTMRSLYEIQRDAAESAIGDDLARLMLVDPAGKAK